MACVDFCSTDYSIARQSGMLDDAVECIIYVLFDESRNYNDCPLIVRYYFTSSRSSIVESGGGLKSYVFTHAGVVFIKAPTVAQRQQNEVDREALEAARYELAAVDATIDHLGLAGTARWQHGE